MTNLLQKNAIDCQNFKEANKTPECTGITNPDNPTNYLTWNLYYAPFDQIQEEIIRLFNKQFILSLDQIRTKLPQYNKFVLKKILTQIIRQNIIIHNKWGFKNYLRSNNELYFLTIDKFDNGTWLDFYYSKFVKNKPLTIAFDKIINILFANQCSFILASFENNDSIRKSFKEFPIDIQEQLLQFVLAHKSNKYPKFSEWLKTEYKTAWSKKASKIVVYLRHLKDKKFPIKQLNGKKWEISKYEINFGKEIFNNFVKKNPFIGVQDTKLIILDVRNVRTLEKSQGSKKLRGIACSSMKGDSWIALLKYLKIEKDGTHKYLCAKVADKLKEKNLVIDKNEKDMLNRYMKENKLAFFQK